MLTLANSDFICYNKFNFKTYYNGANMIDIDNYVDIKDFDGYRINKNGQVISLKKKQPRLLTNVVNSAGYYMVGLYRDGTQYNKNIHRLLMETFVPVSLLKDNTKDLHKHYILNVNHKDGNKLNNTLDNLEWVTPQQNILHARLIGLSPEIPVNAKPVYLYNCNTGEFLQQFKTGQAAGDFLNLPNSSITWGIKRKSIVKKKYFVTHEYFEKYPYPLSTKIIAESYIVKDMKTNKTHVFSTMVEVSNHIKMHRASILRRFKKSNNFFYENYHITKQIIK